MDGSGSTRLQARGGSALPRCLKGRQIPMSQRLARVRCPNPGSLLGAGWAPAAAGSGPGPGSVLREGCGRKGRQKDRKRVRKQGPVCRYCKKRFGFFLEKTEMISAFKYIQSCLCWEGGSNEPLLLPHTCIIFKPFGIFPCIHPLCCSFRLLLRSVSRGSGCTSAPRRAPSLCSPRLREPCEALRGSAQGSQTFRDLDSNTALNRLCPIAHAFEGHLLAS